MPENKEVDQRIQTLTDEVSRLRAARHDAADREHEFSLSLTEIKLNLANQDKVLGQIRTDLRGNGRPGLITDLAVLSSKFESEQKQNREYRKITDGLVNYKWWLTGGVALLAVLVPIVAEWLMYHGRH